jgi:hypothetical protein
VISSVLTSLIAGSLFLAAFPSTTNYQLNSYGFGSGGTANSSTSAYSLEGQTGDISSQADATSTYSLKPGFIETQQANVPNVTLTNPSSYYDKLHFVIDQQNNPSDALYALQVCVGGGFPCGTPLYVKADNTLGTTLTTGDYQLYSAWGGSGGANIIGLTGSTTYYIRAKATQGKFTESAYGPSSNAATSAQQISFCLFAGASCGSGSTTSFSGLVAGSVSNSSPNLGLTFSTNADSGGSIYIYSTGKLQSVTVPSGTINSATANLGSANSGYGAQVTTAPSFTIVSPYNGSANNVGAITTTISTLLDATAPINSSATIQLQAKASNTTPAATDYADTVTVIAAARF